MGKKVYLYANEVFQTRSESREAKREGWFLGNFVSSSRIRKGGRGRQRDNVREGGEKSAWVVLQFPPDKVTNPLKWECLIMRTLVQKELFWIFLRLVIGWVIRMPLALGRAQATHIMCQVSFEMRKVNWTWDISYRNPNIVSVTNSDCPCISVCLISISWLLGWG